MIQSRAEREARRPAVDPGELLPPGQRGAQPGGQVVQHLDNRSRAAAVAERRVPQQRHYLQVVRRELDVLLGQQVAELPERPAPPGVVQLGAAGPEADQPLGRPGDHQGGGVAGPGGGVSKSTVHRRFLIWSRAGVWGRLHEAVLERTEDVGLLDVSRVVLDPAHVRAK